MDSRDGSVENIRRASPNRDNSARVFIRSYNKGVLGVILFGNELFSTYNIISPSFFHTIMVLVMMIPLE